MAQTNVRGNRKTIGELANPPAQQPRRSMGVVSTAPKNPVREPPKTPRKRTGGLPEGSNLPTGGREMRGVPATRAMAPDVGALREGTRLATAPKPEPHELTLEGAVEHASKHHLAGISAPTTDQRNVAAAKVHQEAMQVHTGEVSLKDARPEVQNLVNVQRRGHQVAATMREAATSSTTVSERSLEETGADLARRTKETPERQPIKGLNLTSKQFEDLAGSDSMGGAVVPEKPRTGTIKGGGKEPGDWREAPQWQRMSVVAERGAGASIHAGEGTVSPEQGGGRINATMGKSGGVGFGAERAADIAMGKIKKSVAGIQDSTITSEHSDAVLKVGKQLFGHVAKEADPGMARTAIGLFANRVHALAKNSGRTPEGLTPHHYAAVADTVNADLEQHMVSGADLGHHMSRGTFDMRAPGKGIRDLMKPAVGGNAVGGGEVLTPGSAEKWNKRRVDSGDWAADDMPVVKTPSPEHDAALSDMVQSTPSELKASQFGRELTDTEREALPPHEVELHTQVRMEQAKQDKARAKRAAGLLSAEVGAATARGEKYTPGESVGGSEAGDQFVDLTSKQAGVKVGGKMVGGQAIVPGAKRRRDIARAEVVWSSENAEREAAHKTRAKKSEERAEGQRQEAKDARTVASQRITGMEQAVAKGEAYRAQSTAQTVHEGKRGTAAEMTAPNRAVGWKNALGSSKPSREAVESEITRRTAGLSPDTGLDVHVEEYTRGNQALRGALQKAATRGEQESSRGRGQRAFKGAGSVAGARTPAPGKERSKSGGFIPGVGTEPTREAPLSEKETNQAAQKLGKKLNTPKGRNGEFGTGSAK